MSTFAPNSDSIRPLRHSSDEALALSRLEDRISPLLSVIAGMVDLTGFFTLGNIFTAHVTGNLVVVAAFAVRGGPVNLAQIIAIPVFMLALAVVWFVARASRLRGAGLARLLLGQLEGRDEVRTALIALADLDLPVMRHRLGETDAAPAGAVGLSEKLSRADGLVIVAPNYKDGYPGSLKNAFDYLPAARPCGSWSSAPPAT